MRWVVCSIVVVALVSTQGAGLRGEDEWKRFYPPQTNISALMPGEPSHRILTTTWHHFPIHNQTYTAKNEGGGVFTIDYSHVPGAAVVFTGKDHIYDSARGALLNKTLGKQLSYTNITVSNHAGKQLVYETPALEGHPAMAAKAYLLLVSDRLYVLDGAVPKDGSSGDLERFLLSVEIAKDN